MYSSSYSACEVTRVLILHPLDFMVLISGSYLVCLCVRACSGNLSWQCVNSMNWTVYVAHVAIIFFPIENYVFWPTLMCAINLPHANWPTFPTTWFIPISACEYSNLHINICTYSMGVWYLNKQVHFCSIMVEQPFGTYVSNTWTLE